MVKVSLSLNNYLCLPRPGVFWIPGKDRDSGSALTEFTFGRGEANTHLQDNFFEP